VPRRLEFPAKALAREQLKELRGSLTPHMSEETYDDALLKCYPRGEALSPPRLIKELVDTLEGVLELAEVANTGNPL